MRRLISEGILDLDAIDRAAGELGLHSHFALERLLHDRLAHRRVRGEWFDLSQSDVDALCAIK